jgi:exopolyphosphatase/guanosine-5'-triphosphate,3'-diphosphate pyrophosphatase
VIDVGSNSVLLLTVAVSPDGHARAVDEAVATTRLGTGLGAGGALDPAATVRTLAAATAFATRTRAGGAAEVWAFATGAVRDANDGAAFADRLAAATDVPVEVLSGVREARLAWAAIQGGLDLGDRPVLVCDVGGRSTEMVLDGSEVASLPLGALALTEANAADARALAHAVDERLEEAGLPARARERRARLVASGGTATALAALDLELATYVAPRVHAHRLAAPRLDALVARLTGLTEDERRRLPGLDPGRAAILPAGAIVLARIAAAVGAREVLVSDHGVRHAYLRERLAAAGVRADFRSLWG